MLKLTTSLLKNRDHFSNSDLCQFDGDCTGNIDCGLNDSKLERLFLSVPSLYRFDQFRFLIMVIIHHIFQLPRNESSLDDFNLLRSRT